ncbi:sensor histidine kinase [uncultured Microscilla sp.]|uniref:sensor histidine kinase n=1 Tax=uncultured Microscilla sp. TaxID=432653 RepID=UPI002632F758|nr:histidine kinase [uncultured Microscilla sp.]
MNKLKKCQQRFAKLMSRRHERYFTWVDYIHTLLTALPIGLGVGLVFGVMNKHYEISLLIGVTQGVVIGCCLTFAIQISLYLSDKISWKPISFSLVFLVMVINCFVGVKIIGWISVYWWGANPSSIGVTVVLIVFYTALGMIIFTKIHQRAQLDSKITEQELKLMELKQLKTQAELDALHARVNPHFLYNTLNSIASLIHANPDKAEQMTLLLSKFFRYNTNRKNNHLTTIGEELDMVATYLEIEKVRFGDRLNYQLDLPPGAKNYLIPRFLLQPLVENALKHGIAKLAEKGKLSLTINTENDQIKVMIGDNGPGFSDELVSGYGLKSTREKLELLFPGNADFYFENSPKKQLVITLKKMLAHEYTKNKQAIQNRYN